MNKSELNIIRYRFRDYDDEIAGHVYLDPNVETHGFMIICQGMPYIPCIEAIVPVFVGKGLAAIQIQYPGTYDSGGLFTPTEVINSIVNFTAALSNGKELLDIRKLEPIIFSRDFCFVSGHSFGSWVAYSVCMQSKAIDAGILFAPYFGFTQIHGVNDTDSLLNHLDYVRRASPFTHRFHDNSIWDDLYSGKELFTKGKVRCPVFSFLGSTDGGLNGATINQWIKSQCDEKLNPVDIVPGVGHGLEGFADSSYFLDILGKIMNYATV